MLEIPTREDAEENDIVYLYWGRSGRIWRCLSNGDGVVDFRTVYLYWRWSSRVRCCRSLMGTLGRALGDRSLLGTV